MSTVAAHGTGIEWTHIPGYKGETWNPVTGCDRISPGCANCYARTMARRLKAMGQPHYQRDGDGPGFGVTTHPDTLDQPLRWKKPRAVFVNSMSDLFHDEVSDEFIDGVYRTMGLSPAHIFMVLTKRPERALEFLSGRRWRQFGHSPNMGGKPCFPIIKGEHRDGDIPLPNVWLGVSIENSRFTWRADVLREIPAAVRFISAEPLLGSLFDGPTWASDAPTPMAAGKVTTKKNPLNLKGIDWVIAGGESGHGARPMHPDWARELRDACLSEDYVGPGEVDRVGPAFFFKQWGEHAPGGPPNGDRGALRILGRDGKIRTYYELMADTSCVAPTAVTRVGKKNAGRLLDGREWNEFPRSAA